MNPDHAAQGVVTGAGGFVGQALAARLGPGARSLRLSGDDWRAQVAGATWKGAVVFHLAARVHRAGRDDQVLFELDNVEKTRVLAEAASRGGARRIVFLSSVKVHGEESPGRGFTASDAPRPEGSYARSKWRAEQVLAECGRSMGIEVVVVRAPLVVGPGAGGNLRELLGLVDSPWPLPFGAIHNRRTLVALRDLVALLGLAGAHPAAAGRTLLAGTAVPVSTPEIVAALRRALGRPARLFAFPALALEALGGSRMRRLTRSLEIDASETTRLLGWAPTSPIEHALAEMARAARA